MPELNENSEYVDVIRQWASDAGLSSASGRDLSPFLTGALLVAAADGELSDTEFDDLNVLQQALTGKELSDDELDGEIEYVEKNGFEGSAAAVAEAITDPKERSFLIKFAAVIASGDDGLGDDAADSLGALGKTLGLSEQQVQQLVDEAVGSDEDVDQAATA